MLWLSHELKGSRDIETRCREFIIHRPGYEIMNLPWGDCLTDTVFYTKEVPVNAEEVRLSLINHDGYPSDIIVKEGGA
jgi:hypothetical protein